MGYSDFVRELEKTRALSFFSFLHPFVVNPDETKNILCHPISLLFLFLTHFHSLSSVDENNDGFIASSGSFPSFFLDFLQSFETWFFCFSFQDFISFIQLFKNMKN